MSARTLPAGRRSCAGDFGTVADRWRHSLVATCEARGINPFAYLVDVLARIGDHPASQLDQLLPAAWTPAVA